MKIKAVDFVMYHVSDLKRGIDFYQNVLGLKPYGEPGEAWAEFEAGNVTLDIGTFSQEDIGKAACLGLAVDDVKQAVEELRAKGVKVLSDVWESPVCHCATIADPDGNKIYLHHRKDGTAG